MTPQQPSIDTIMRMLAGVFGVTKQELLAHRRDKTSVLARQTGMWLAARLTSHSLPVIGRHFERDHTSVGQAVKKIDLLMESDPTVGQVILGLMDSLTLPPEMIS